MAASIGDHWLRKNVLLLLLLFGAIISLHSGSLAADCLLMLAHTRAQSSAASRLSHLCARGVDVSSRRDHNHRHPKARKRPWTRESVVPCCVHLLAHANNDSNDDDAATLTRNKTPNVSWGCVCCCVHRKCWCARVRALHLSGARAFELLRAHSAQLVCTAAHRCLSLSRTRTHTHKRKHKDSQTHQLLAHTQTQHTLTRTRTDAAIALMRTPLCVNKSARCNVRHAHSSISSISSSRSEFVVALLALMGGGNTGSIIQQQQQQQS